MSIDIIGSQGPSENNHLVADLAGRGGDTKSEQAHTIEPADQGIANGHKPDANVLGELRQVQQQNGAGTGGTDYENEENLNESQAFNSKGKKKPEKKSKKDQSSSSSKKQKVSKKKENAAKDGKIASSNSKSPVKTPNSSDPTKPRALVEELKLFQNNNLLNQQDPMLQLHKQLNEIIRNDDSRNRGRSPLVTQRQKPDSNGLTAAESLYQDQSTALQQHKLVMDTPLGNMTIETSDDTTNESLSTVKKGIMWQQQQHDKFHQRLFSRWKKRYFILTTDYLVCFKRSASKVGRSEMGKFLYKISLNEIRNIQWTKPKKSDKGAIILNTNKQLNLFLWTKENLDEWMFLMKESIERLKTRKSIHNNHNLSINPNEKPHQQQLLCNQVTCEDLYANTNGPIPSEPFESGSMSNTGNIEQIRPTHGFETITEHSVAVPQDQPFDESVEQRSQQQKFANNSAGNGSNSSTNSPRALNSKDPIASKEQAIPSSRGRAKRETANLIEREHNQDDNNDQGIDNEEKSGSSESHLAQPSGRNRDQIMIYDPAKSDDVSRSNGTITSGQHTSESARSIPATPNSRQSSRSHRQNSSSKQSAGRLHNLSSSNTNRSADDAPSIKDDSELLARDEAKCDTRGSTEERQHKQSRRNIDAESSSSRVCDIGQPLGKIPDKSLVSVSNPEKPTPQAPIRPQTNLIRRDDSWQSLVSLTRIGKTVAAAPNQQAGSAVASVAQRSLYAQHIMPDSNSKDSPLGRQQQHNRINIESTVTPIRGPLSRQQSIQLVNQKKFRPLPPLGQHAASFDVPNQQQQQQLQNSPLAFQANQRNTSYQHKLLQLQLLHNSNNIDYIRHNGNGSANDYGIYGPDSTCNPYGYYSMRSNLKSAASEFSFIRPSSSSNNTQSTLPHNHNQQQQQLQTTQAFYNQGTRQQPLRNSLMLSQQEERLGSNGAGIGQFRDSNNNNIDCLLSPIANHATSKQFLVNPLTGERLTNQQQLQQLVNAAGSNAQLISTPEDCSLLMQPPTRELPLKPNKRRAPVDAAIMAGGHLPKSSSLTSNIICFFKRAFSRRSKKGQKNRSNLAESCSSSLGAFNDNFVAIPIAPSAFSTGGKSADAGNLPQNQRMADMIEALRNETLVRADNGNHQAHQIQNQAMRQHFAENLDFLAQSKAPAQDHQVRALNQFGSPLHKSNSVSTAIGIADTNNRMAFLYDNEQMITPGERSPMVSRSSKVMSVNLTPIMSQRGQLGEQGQNQLFMSPRNQRGDPLPRPSSIYGQPSMISSPVVMHEERSNKFGLHRSSMNNQQYGRDRHFNQAQIVDNRRHHMMKMQLLDTTREVAEEVLSPTIEQENYNYENSVTPAKMNAASHLSQRHQLASTKEGTFDRTRQAVVNPILQSTTMDAIYDNHPMLDNSDRRHELASFSHYDNHNQLLMEIGQDQRASPDHQSNVNLMRHQLLSHEYPQSPMIPVEARRAQQFYTPMHQRSAVSERNSSIDTMGLHASKPSAIVAPSAPDREFEYVRRSFDSPVMDRRWIVNPLRVNQRSPALPRRPTESHYQQSPLVNNQTRIINKGDGVQATIIDGNSRNHLQPVVNIAGAPGIKLDPSLAASLLRGTNINAYESTTSNLIQPGPSKSQTFLVSTRLSKTLVRNQSPHNGNSSSSRTSEDETIEMESRSNQSSKASSSGSQRRNSKDVGKVKTRNTMCEKHRKQIAKNDDSSENDNVSVRKDSKSSASSVGDDSLILME